MIFFLLGGLLIFMNVSAYLFKDGYDAALNQVKIVTNGAASEISRASEAAAQSLARTHRNASLLYRGMSFEFIPAEVSAGVLGARIPAGTWEHIGRAGVPAVVDHTQRMVGHDRAPAG